MCARGPCRVDAHCHTAVHTRTRVRAPLLQNLQIACVRSDRYLLAQHFWAPSRTVFSPPRLYYKSTCVFFPPTFFMVLFFMVKTLSFWNLFGREAGSRDSVPPEAFLPQMTSQSVALPRRTEHAVSLQFIVFEDPTRLSGVISGSAQFHCRGEVSVTTPRVVAFLSGRAPQVTSLPRQGFLARPGSTL